MDKQRIYDAMLIKAFRKDVRMTDLERWLAPYQIKLIEDKLMRVPDRVWWPGRVQEMVGRYMKPLANRLWDTDKSKDIDTLNWMSKLQCGKENIKWDREKTKLQKESNNNRRKAGIIFEGMENTKRSNQWSVNK